MTKYPQNIIDPILPNKFPLTWWRSAKANNLIKFATADFSSFYHISRGTFGFDVSFSLPPAIGGRWIIKRDQPHQWIIKQGFDVYSASLELGTRTSRLFPVRSRPFKWLLEWILPFAYCFEALTFFASIWRSNKINGRRFLTKSVSIKGFRSQDYIRVWE